MGIFDRDYEYMDDDERRLLRDSERRRKEELRKAKSDPNYHTYNQNPITHNECDADHSDDGMKFGGYKSHDDCDAEHDDDVRYGSSVSHKDCEADHSDDGPKPYNVAPKPVPTYRPAPATTVKPNNNRRTQNTNNKVAGVAIFIAIMMVIAGMAAPIIFRDNKESTSTKTTKPTISIITDVKHADKDIVKRNLLIGMEAYHYSRVELVHYLTSDEEGCFGYDVETVEELIDQLVDSGDIDFAVAAQWRIIRISGFATMSDEEIASALVELGFTDDEALSAISLYHGLASTAESLYEEHIEE